MGRGPLALTGIILCSIAACGSREPKTYSVSGKVVFKGGNIEKLKGWVVQFQSIAEPDQRAVAEIGEGGTFKAVSVVSNRAKEGIVEGEHGVCVINVLAPESKVLHPKFAKFETSEIKVTVPLEKELVIYVWR